MFKRLGRMAVRHPWLICVAWLATGLGVSAVAPSGDRRVLDDDVRFLPEQLTTASAATTSWKRPSPATCSPAVPSSPSNAVTPP